MKKSVFDTIAAQPAGLLAGVAALLVFFAVGIWWLLQPEYAALYKDASETGRAEVTRLLSEQKIPYRLGKDGAVEVREGDIDAARAGLVEAGLPAERGKGYELFDNSDYGMSEFAQKINYQRALEGELARSLMGLREIKFARVHLMLRKSSLYSSQQENAKASVILQLRSGMSLDRKQISGIQQLVASSVDGLQPETVVVIDETGQPLNGQQGYAAFDERWQISTRIEGELQAKAQAVLDRIYGAGKAQASVRVQMNFDKVRAVKELPLAIDGNGNGIVVREKQQQSFDNKKNAEAVEPNGREQHSDEIEYAVGKNHSETEYSQGKIERISVGVVLSESLASVDAKSLNDVLGATLGLSEERGDRLSVAYSPVVALATGVDQESTPVVTPPVAKAVTVIPPWSWVVVAVLAAVVVLLLLLLLASRRRALPVQKPALSAAEREKLLQDVRRWLKQPDQEELS